jgi:GT2 family glycosyltransferase
VQLSVIIVSYNVRYFLEQCLHAVQKAVQRIDAEIIVIDNASADQSVAFLSPVFPAVYFISNAENRGFAAANNQGFAIAKGEYILVLNPDTLIPESAITTALQYLQEHAEVAAAGFHMIDGRGKFLPESKRSFPSPWAAFAKLTGLSALFPYSGFLNRYALGQLAEKEIHAVDVLAGAAMLIRKQAIEQVGGFDESFFLYGEDIDLSYRLRKAGFSNIYLGNISIIHFKGESSSGDWLRRTKYFYAAMLIFVRKHYAGGSRLLFSLLLQTAILLRGLLSVFTFLLRPVATLVLEILFTWLCLQAFRWYWITEIRTGKDFGVAFVPYALVLFSSILIAGSRLFSIRGTGQYGLGWLLVAAVYALLPEHLRFSRGVILGGSLLSAVLLFIIKTQLQNRRLQKRPGTDAALFAWASEKDYASLSELLEQAQAGDQLIQRISVRGNHNEDPIRQSANSSIRESLPHALVCCIGDLRLQTVIDAFPSLHNHPCLFYYSGSNSIVGSHTLAPGATIVSPHLPYRLSSPVERGWKRLLDIITALFLLFSFPMHLLLHKKPIQVFSNAVAVLTGRFTWVGYVQPQTGLPALPPAILSHTVLTKDPFQSDRYYARHYQVWMDFRRMLRAYRQLGNTRLHSDM